MAKKSKKHAAKRHRVSVTKKVKKKAVKKKAGKPAGAPSTAVRDRCLDLLRFARDTMNKFIGGVPESQATAQPGGLPNHVLWTYGHLASTAAWAASLIKGSAIDIPENYEKLFGMESKPIDDASQYPPLAEVKGHFDRTMADLMQAAKGLNDAQLAAPVEASGFAKDKADLLVKVAWHEGWHLGQIADLRRALGLPRALGG